MSAPRWSAIVVAAGRGERLGVDRPKALVEVAGVALVVHAVDRLAAAGADHVVVVHPPDGRTAFVEVLGDRPVRLTAGGAERSDSVRAGLDVLGPEVEVVAVHDAARGLQPAATIAAACRAVDGDVVAAAPALPVVDTLKRTDGDQLVATVDRSDLVAVQTPQVVRAGLLRAGHRDGAGATDDLGLVERLLAPGQRVVHVPGSPLGRKVTYPDDLAILEALLGEGVAR